MNIRVFSAEDATNLSGRTDQHCAGTPRVTRAAHDDYLGRGTNCTPFTLHPGAAESGYCNAILTMVSAGADVNHWAASSKAAAEAASWGRYQHFGWTPLHVAARLPAVARLIKAGAYVHATNDAGETPLHLAAFWNHRDVVQKLR